MIHNKLDYGVGILGTGKYVPEAIITNAQIEAWTGLKASEIEAKTGILERRKAGNNQSTSEMSAIAANHALIEAGVSAENLSLVTTCTFTGDYVYPAVSCKIAELIGAKNAGAFDLLANCTGFQVGLGVVSDRMLVDPTCE